MCHLSPYFLGGEQGWERFQKGRKERGQKEIEVRRKKVSKVLGKCRVENTQILDPSVFFAKPCVTRRILHKYSEIKCIDLK